MAVQTLVDPRNANAEGKTSNFGLSDWIMWNVRENRFIRDRRYKPMWDRYERTYKGQWDPADKVRESERSRLIAPALLQAIDSTAAAIEDAIFGRDRWFDLDDDFLDREGNATDDVGAIRERLTEDMDIAGMPNAISRMILNGCLYGTGIMKLNVIKKKIVEIENGNPIESMRPLVVGCEIAPWEFVIDSNARRVDDAMFCAHEFVVPMSLVKRRQREGVWRNVRVGTFYYSSGVQRPGGEDIVDATGRQVEPSPGTMICEYYGRVPKRLIPGAEGPEDSAGMVEAIVTIANETHVLKAVENPFLLKDRPIVAYQHTTNPGRFWGIGVSEKGWNSQKALDAELRARMDTTALVTSPMMGADITRLPRNPDMKVRPGKVWLTRGRPSEVLEPINLGGLSPESFTSTSDLERMVQTATGAIDSNAPLDTNRRNETASGISMIQSSALKRMRRTMWNLERQALNPLIKKTYARYMQFAPDAYPMDITFLVKGTLGMVAREFEQSSLTALLSVVSPEHPIYPVIVKGVVELSGSPKRDEMLKAIEAAMQPSPEQQAMQQAQMQAVMLQVQQAQAELDKTKMETQKLLAEIQQIVKETDLKDEEVDIQAANAITGRDKNKIQAQRNEIDSKKLDLEEKKLRKQNSSTSNG